MKYCMNCGRQSPDGAKFCVGCGASMVEPEAASPRSERKIEYAGSVYKCPNCGEVLDAMAAICPACGYEIRNKKAVSSVQTFANQLAAIEAERMPENNTPSLMKKLIGLDLRDRSEEVEAARKKFEAEKKARKISLISNYPVPNTKEDLVEFALLVTTNLQNKPDLDTYSAWVNKLEQVYQKARILIPNDPMLGKIRDLYSEARKKAITKKLLPLYILGGLFALLLIVTGFAYKPVLTSVILGLGLILMIVYIILSKNHSKRRQ